MLLMQKCLEKGGDHITRYMYLIEEIMTRY